MTQTASYGPDPVLVGFWALLCSAPALVAGYLLRKSPTHDALVQFAWTLCFPLMPIVFASRLRATFAQTELVYRRWGPTVRVPYSDISRIEVTNVTPVTKAATGAVIVTKSGKRLPFWPKLFPKEAIRRLFELAPS